MLARADAIPHGRGWVFEPKLDGFRALVCTHAGLRAQKPARLGHDAPAARVPPEHPRGPATRWRACRARRRRPPRLPPAQLEDAARPHRHRVDAVRLRRARGRGVRDDDAALRGAAGDPRGARPGESAGAARRDVRGWRGAVRGRLCSWARGVVAKRANSVYVPGDRGSWVKTKNRSTPRFAEERRRSLRGVRAGQRRGA